MRLHFKNRYGVQVARTLTHIYLLPHPALRDVVAHYTLCLPGPGAADAGALDLIPDASGCLVYTLLPGGVLDGRMYGPTTKVVTVEADFESCPFRFFVEFRPGGLSSFTPIPQHELADKVCLLEDAAPPLLALVRSLFGHEADLDEFVRVVDLRLAALHTGPAPILPMLRHLAGHFAPASAADLAADAGYSQRHLSRLFREGSGLSAKAFSRVLRINEAVRRLPTAPSLTALAQDLGYYDQPHFIHDFRAVCGVPPSAYLERMAGFYNEPLKF